MNTRSPGRIIKKLLIDEYRAVSWLADKMGIRAQTLSNKLYRDSFTTQEFLKVLDILGYDFHIKKKETL